MAPKKKNANKKGPKNAKDDDFDLDSILEAEGLVEKVEEVSQEVTKEIPKDPTPAVQIENFANVDDAAAAFLSSLSNQLLQQVERRKTRRRSLQLTLQAQKRRLLKELLEPKQRLRLLQHLQKVERRRRVRKKRLPSSLQLL